MTAITTTQVTGRIALADDTSLTGGTVLFTLSGYETDPESDVTIIPHAVSAAIDAAGDIDIDLWPNADGLRGTRYGVTVLHRDKGQYVRYALGEITVPESGPVDLNDLLGTVVVVSSGAIVRTPEEFGDTTTDSTAAINAMFAFCIPRKLKCLVHGAHNITGTIGPGGTYHCEWVGAHLTYTGSDPATDLVEVLENPTGTTEPEGSGKYVLFDTKDCGDSVNIGRLTLQASAPGRMRLANESLIPSNVIAVTASSGGSGNMQWGGIVGIGCGHLLWQGDQRGSAPNILPYTGWKVDYLQGQFILETLVPGQSGNSLDDASFGVVRFIRCKDHGAIRTDWNTNSVFLRGKTMANDSETITVDATGSSVTLSSDILDGDSVSRIAVGMVAVIEHAGPDVGEATRSPHVSRISAKSGTTLTLETAVSANVTGKRIVFNPPSFRAANGDFNPDHFYVEGLLDAPVLVQNQGAFKCDDFKISDGEFCARHNGPIIMAGTQGMLVDVTLNQRSGKFNSFAEYMVVWGALVSGGATNRGVVKIQTRDAEGDFVAGSSIQPVGVVALESDLAGGATVAHGVQGGMGQQIEVSFDDGTRYYYTHALGPAPKGPKRNGYDILGLSANQRGDTDMDGVSRSGSCLAPSGGVVSKVADGVGFWWEDIGTQTPGDLLYVEIDIDTLGVGGVQFRLADSGGSDTPAGDLTTVGVPFLGTGTCKFHVEVPAGVTSDRLVIQCFDLSRVQISRCIVKRVTVN